MRWALLLIGAMTLAGCEAPSPGAGEPICGAFSLGLEKTRIHPGEEAGLHVRVENCGTSPLSLGLVPHCQRNGLYANVSVQGESYEITRGAAQKTPPRFENCQENAAQESLPPGHVRDLRLTWNGTLGEGTPALPGIYTIASAWTALENANVTKTATLQIEVT